MQKDITIFHYENEKWTKKHYKGIFQGGLGASLNKGFEKANDVKIWLFYNDNKNLNIKDVHIKDIIVKEFVNEDIKILSDLNKYEGFNITTLINRDYGSQNLQHIFIGAK